MAEPSEKGGMGLLIEWAHNITDGLEPWARTVVLSIIAFVSFLSLLILWALIRIGWAKLRGKEIKYPPRQEWEQMRRKYGKKPKWDEWDEDR